MVICLQKALSILRKDYTLGLFFLFRDICVLTQPERLFKLLYLWQITQGSKGMVVGLVFHHTFGCGNLASFPIREEACGPAIISCGVMLSEMVRVLKHLLIQTWLQLHFFSWVSSYATGHSKKDSFAASSSCSQPLISKDLRF